MKRFIVLSLLALLLAGCTQTAVPPPETPPAESSPVETTPAEPEPPPFVWSEANFPRMDGSTATIPLGQAVAATLLDQSRAEAEPRALFSGTNSAYRKLAHSETDVLIVYEGSPETLAEYREQFELAPIGRDALVFLVNVQNTVDSLTTAQLQDIYTGATKNWNEVGGQDAEILPYQRNHTSGSQTMMEKLVMPGLELDTPPADYVIGDMGGLVAAIAAYDNARSAIGYNVYYYVTNMKMDENVKLLSVDGVAPSSESIGSGAYPFVNDFYAVIRKDEPEGSPARRLFDWLCGEQAVALMRSEGYVPIG